MADGGIQVLLARDWHLVKGLAGGNIINGEFVPTPTTRHSIDPATGEPLYEVLSVVLQIAWWHGVVYIP